MPISVLKTSFWRGANSIMTFFKRPLLSCHFKSDFKPLNGGVSNNISFSTLKTSSKRETEFLKSSVIETNFTCFYDLYFNFLCHFFKLIRKLENHRVNLIQSRQFLYFIFYFPINTKGTSSSPSMPTSIRSVIPFSHS